MLQDSISNPLPKVEGTWFVKNRDGWKELEAPAATHPITPPEELVRAWASLVEPHGIADVFASIAQWGADQELEACIDWISAWHGLEHPELLIELLRAARRPKPPSLKARLSKAIVEGDERQALKLLEELDDSL